VRKLSGCGLNHAQICTHLNVRSKKTLWKWYRHDLKLGRVYAAIEVFKANFELAVSGKNPTMTIAWLRWFGAWGPKMEVESPEKGKGFRAILTCTSVNPRTHPTGFLRI
jgi:hypothetical protein